MKAKVTEGESVKKVVLPPWFAEIVSRFKSGISSVFLLHGDITCLTPNPNGDDEPRYPYIPLQELLARVFDQRDMVIFYNIATGMRFLRPEMEKKFREVAGLVSETDDSAGDPVVAAKAKLDAKRPLPREPEICLPFVEKVLGQMDSVAVIIEDVHFITSETSGVGLSILERTNIARIKAWAQDARVKKRSNIVIMLTDLATKVSGELRQSASRITQVFIPKPGSEERKLYVQRLTEGTPEQSKLERQIRALEKKLEKDEDDEEAADELGRLQEELRKYPIHFEKPKGFDIDVFVNATQGMSLRQILEIFRYASQEGKLQDLDLDMVKAKKRDILTAEYGDVMEVTDPQWDLDQIGGMVKQKAYFAMVLRAIKRGEIRFIPQGITIMGPPGTGKTALVEALAKGAQFNFVKMKNARSMWVGQSEERTERQIQGLYALAPVIVMNDEADLGEANRDAPKGDSGVSERIMQAWMRFLSDSRIRGKVIMINCTNRPDRMDAAMKRSGRSDDRIAILMPAKEERAAIFRVMFRRYKIPTTITDFTLFAELTKGLSGADIESISLKSFRSAGEQMKDSVDEVFLKEAIEDFIPSASQPDIDFMTLLAISESSSRKLLPDNMPEIIRDIRQRNLVTGGDELIAQIVARKIIDPKYLEE